MQGQKCIWLASQLGGAACRALAATHARPLLPLLCPQLPHHPSTTQPRPLTAEADQLFLRHLAGVNQEVPDALNLVCSHGMAGPEWEDEAG
jgi:hypothetical protein